MYLKGRTIATLPSMTATQELVVPKSIPMTSFPAGLALHEENKVNNTMIPKESFHTAR